jgi:hypothetical protein
MSYRRMAHTTGNDRGGETHCELRFSRPTSQQNYTEYNFLLMRQKAVQTRDLLVPGGTASGTRSLRSSSTPHHKSRYTHSLIGLDAACSPLYATLLTFPKHESHAPTNIARASVRLGAQPSGEQWFMQAIMHVIVPHLHMQCFYDLFSV